MIPRWITESEVSQVINMRAAIDALHAGFAAERVGEATSMVKTQVTWGAGDSLHALGAVMPKAGLVGSKTWAHTGQGVAPLVIVWGSETGELLAVIEAFALGQLRTGGVSGLATDLLAPDEAKVLAIVGTGKQAFTQVAGVAAVRQVEEVRVFGRDPERRSALVGLVEGELGIASRVCESVADAVQEATVVTLATRATEPFLTSSMVRSGSHLNAIGAIVQTRMEFEPALLDRAEVVVVDSPAQARMHSAELRGYFGEDERAWSAVRSLADFTGSSSRGGPGAGISVFKAMGSGIADLSLARLLVEQASEENIGMPLPQPKIAPRLSVATGSSP
jgi:ornithine cyclodeaminase/alanine dehydrogenase-like protein (mu-crystallin family)